MRKLILGIIAVVFVQIGFNAYIARDTGAKPGVVAENLSSDENDRAIEPNVELAEAIEPAYSIGEPSVNRPEVIRTTSSETRVAKADIRSRALIMNRRRAARADSTQQYDLGALRKPTVIQYDRDPAVKSPLDRNPDADERAKREVRKPDKRSLIAKARPVLKKPWDWMKAIGSLLR